MSDRDDINENEDAAHADIQEVDGYPSGTEAVHDSGSSGESNVSTPPLSGNRNVMVNISKQLTKLNSNIIQLNKKVDLLIQLQCLAVGSIVSIKIKKKYFILFIE
jgi:hypothetical protein